MHLRAAPILCALVTFTNAAVASESCREDLEVIPPFLLENDTGAKDELAALGQAHFDAAMAKAREGAAEAGDIPACDKVLNGYLKAWRKGHLWVDDVQPAPASTSPEAAAANLETSRLPTIKLLSGKTALLTVPSFAGQYRDPLIRLLAQHRKQLATRVNWIIDVRDNDGGDDTTFYPLLPWLMPDEREEVGAAWLVTAANIEGQEKACALFAPGDKDCGESLAEAVKRMHAASPGSYVQQEDGPPIHFVRADKLEPHRPARVAVLIDSPCGSSCEEFLLAARQSFNVKLVGRRSHGSLAPSIAVGGTK
jgi:Peptidase family S41